MDYIIFSRFYVFATTSIFVSSQRQFIQEYNGMKNFKYRNCNTSSVPFYVNYLDISPDPVKIGQRIHVRYNVTLDTDAGNHNKKIEADISLRMETKKDTILLCPIIGESFCHYNDFCAILNKTGWSIDMPNPMNNAVTCPIKKGTYFWPPISLTTPDLSFEVRGTFDLTVILHEEGQLLGCVEIHFCITDCKPLGF